LRISKTDVQLLAASRYLLFKICAVLSDPLAIQKDTHRFVIFIKYIIGAGPTNFCFGPTLLVPTVWFHFCTTLMDEAVIKRINHHRIYILSIYIINLYKT
jgi:hypothetical protein